MNQINVKKSLPLALLLALLTGLILCPLVTVFAEAVIVDGRLDLYQAWGTIASAENVRTIYNSLLLGICVVLCSTVIAVPTAFILARTQLARHGWLDIVFMIPFMTPPYIASMGWILFMQKRGLFQQLFPATGAWSESFFCFGGLVLVMSLHVFPFLMTMLKNAMLNIPASLEESGGRFRRGRRDADAQNFCAAAHGQLRHRRAAGLRQDALRVRHAVHAGAAALDFTSSPRTSTAIRPPRLSISAARQACPPSSSASAWLCGCCRTASRAVRATVWSEARAAAPRGRASRGSARAAAWLWVAFVVAVAIGVPYFSIISTSLIKLRGYGLAAGNFTLAHYHELLTTPKALGSIWKSLFLAVSSATICSVIGTAVVVAVRRSTGFFKKALECVALLPEMLPSIVLVIGIMLFWNAIYKLVPLYNTIGIMVLAYVVLYVPYTVQYVTSAFTQINDSLLQAGRVFGGTPGYVFRRVTLPMISRGVFAGWMMIFIIAFRELVTASLIAPPNTLVVSTYINREFEQGSVSLGMAMAVLCVLITTTALLAFNRFIGKRKGA